LIEKKIAFIHIGKQMYIPHLCMHLKEIKKEEVKNIGKLSPSAQALLIFNLLKRDLSGI